MNPLENIQKKKNQVTEELTGKVKKELVLWFFEKSNDFIKGLLYMIVFVSFTIFFFLISIFLLFFKGITDFNGEMTYGSSLLGFISLVLISMILSLLVRVFISRKFESFKEGMIEELS